VAWTAIASARSARRIEKGAVAAIDAEKVVSQILLRTNDQHRSRLLLARLKHTHKNRE